MKAFAISSILAAAVLPNLGYTSPLEAVNVPRVNTTLESWGITKFWDTSPVDIKNPLVSRADIACAWRAWPNYNCTGDNGGGTQYVVYGSPYCSKIPDGMHWFNVVGGRCYISADPSPDCAAKDSGKAPGGIAGPGCYNVNTGQAWRSTYVRGA